jgi:hypothetical protein
MAVGQSINPLLVGVNITLLFDLGNKEDCNCIPVYNSKWKKQKTSRTSYIKTPKASAKRYKK